MTNFLIAKPWPVSANSQSSQVTGMEAANLGQPYPTDAWRTANLTSQYVILDLGAAKAVDLVALMYTNLTSAATWRVRAGSTAAVSDWDGGTVTAWAGSVQNVPAPHALLRLSAAQTYRYWRIDLTDAANPDGFFQAGVAVLASAFQPARNYAYGAGRGFNDLSVKQDSFGGGMLFEAKARRPVLSFEAPYLTATEAEAGVMELQRQNDGPVLAMLNPDASTYRMGRMYYGLMTLEPVVNTNFGRHSVRVTVEGLL